MGIVANVTMTLRKSLRNKNRTIVMSTVPMSTSRRTPLSAFSMKFAGRWRLGYSSIPRAVSAGFREAMACSTARVTTSVLAPY